MAKTRRVSLDKLANGGLLEQFQAVMSQVTLNLLDPNTDAEKARKIVMTLTFKGDDEDRTQPSLEFNVKATLASAENGKTKFIIGKQNGNVAFKELLQEDANQLAFGDEDEGDDSGPNERSDRDTEVIDLRAKTGG